MFSSSTEASGNAGFRLTAEERAELEELEREAAEMYEQFTQTAGQLSERATEAYQAGRSFIKRHPGSTLLSSFAAGVVAGLLMGRR